MAKIKKADHPIHRTDISEQPRLSVGDTGRKTEIDAIAGVDGFRVGVERILVGDRRQVVKVEPIQKDALSMRRYRPSMARYAADGCDGSPVYCHSLLDRRSERRLARRSRRK